MIARGLIVTVGFLIVSVCSAQSVKREYADLSLSEFKMPSGTSVYYVRIPLEKFDVRVLAAKVPNEKASYQLQGADPERMASGYSLQDYQRTFDVPIVLSGGYINNYSPPTPLGLVKSRGVQISDIHRSWLVDGFFCSDSKRVEVLTLRVDGMQPAFRDCVQSGPVLLQDRKFPENSARDGTQNYVKFANAQLERTFACVREPAEVVLGITGKIDLPQFISRFLQAEINCKSAIAFTGGPSGGLLFGDRVVGKDDFLYPSVIGVMPTHR